MNMLEIFEAALEAKVNAIVESKVAELYARIDSLEKKVHIVEQENAMLLDQLAAVENKAFTDLDQVKDALDQEGFMTEYDVERYMQDNGYVTTDAVEEMINDLDAVSTSDAEEIVARALQQDVEDMVMEKLQTVKLTVSFD